MAYRQYIGARYVPIYAGDWDSTRNYEPLTIVTDANGNSYTSRKDVPAGTPLNDRDYWIQTASFSGAVAQLQTHVNIIDGEIAQIESDMQALGNGLSAANGRIDAANARIDAISAKTLNGRKFMMIGDSLCRGVIDSETRASDVALFDYLKAASPTVFYFDESTLGGTGFSTNNTFAMQLERAYNQVGSEIANQITDIVVLGGSNETGNIPGVEAGIRTFMEYAREKFPNAKVRIGLMGGLGVKNPDLITQYFTAEKYGAEVMTDGINLMCDPQYLAVGNIHVTYTGYATYLPFMIDLIVDGKTHYDFEIVTPIDLNSAYSVVGGTGIKAVFRVTESYMMGAIRRDPLSAIVAIDVTGSASTLPTAEQGYKAANLGTVASELTLPIVVKNAYATATIAKLNCYSSSGDILTNGYVFLTADRVLRAQYGFSPVGLTGTIKTYELTQDMETLWPYKFR